MKKIFVILFLTAIFFFLKNSPVYANKCVPKILNQCLITEYACTYNFQDYCCPESATQCTTSTGTTNTKPIPLPLVPCDDPGRDPEFHSLRPYQASPCSTETASTAKFCGNDLTLHEKVKVNYPGDEQYLTGVCITSGSTVTCNYSVPVTKTITLNLDVANLPIMGNTEDVPNSQPPTSTESLSDADKMNGYVSWYLNGVIGRAEDGNTKNIDAKNIINFSGPINKLLPSAILDAQRLESINAAKVTNHNQIVVCADPNNGGFWGGLFDLLGLGKYEAKPCYKGDGSPSSGEKVLKLENWKKDKLGFNVGANTAIKIWLAGLKLIFPGAADAIEKSVGKHWTYARPPLPWDNGKGKAFETEVEYQKVYQEWKGNVCVIIPLINKVVCINNIFVPSYYADLYSYVPLSSTEDLKGKIEIENPPAVTSYSSNGIDVSGISFNTDKSSILFFPHMQESTDLANALQDTFVSKDEKEKDNKIGAPTNVSPPASCTTVDVRSNKGDSLFATPIIGDLKYTAAFTCKFNAISTCSGSCLPNERECKYAKGLPGTGSCSNGRFCCNLPGATPTPPPPPQTCEKEVDINLSTLSYTPKVEDIWSQLVAGPQSIFKRIFPKTNTPGGVGQIKDMPGSTTITYTSDSTDQQITQATADLKFPHIGSISEYFLKGIQTALRPKGFGEPISFDPGSPITNLPISCTGGALPTLPGASGYCKFKSLGTVGSANLSSLPTLVAIIEAASQSYNVPPGILLGIMYGEGAFNPGRYDWTDANVKTWGCSSMPNCSPTTFPSTGVVPFFEPYWNSLKTAVNIVDPSRTPNPCNLMDAIFALAKDSSQNRTGSSDFSGKTCYGIFLNNGSSNSAGCTWGTTDYETAIRVWDFGVTFDNTYTCATKKGSCATGGMSAVCPGGDSCETIGGSGNTSHNACVWDVAVSH